MRRRWISFVLPFIGLGIFVYIIANIGLDKIVRVLKGADPVKAAFAPVITLCIAVFRGMRWRYLLKVVGVDYSLFKSTSVYCIGFFAGSVTPAKAGDVVRTLYVMEDTDKTFGQAFLTIFMDRLWDVLFVLVTGIISAFVFSYYYVELPSVWLLVAAAIVLVGCVYLALNKSVVQKLLRPFFNALVPAKYKEQFSLTFHSFYDSLGTYTRDARVMLAAFILTLLSWACIFLLAYYVSVVFGIDVSARYIVLIMPIVTLAELLPISVSGLGTRDASVIYFFSVIGLSSALAVGFSIGYLFAGTYVTAFLGFLMWLRHPVKFRG